MKIEIKELMRTLVTKGFVKMEGVVMFKLHPSILCSIIHSFVSSYWVFNREHPENLKRVEEWVIKYSEEMMSVNFMIFDRKSVNEKWLEKINYRLYQTIAEVPQSVIRENLQLSAIMGSSLIPVLMRLLCYNNSEKGHLFDAMINPYLHYLIIAIK